MTRLLIFDFDGVIADSESLACSVAASYAIELGARIKQGDGLQLFMGKRASDVALIIAERGGVLPHNFVIELQERTLKAFRAELKPVGGVHEFLEWSRLIPRCIASSSSHARLSASLEFLKLNHWFAGSVFSVDDVSRGKPFPDIFLHAAQMMSIEPAKALIIEDSVGGVTAGVAAGIPVAGLLAGTHLKNNDGSHLLKAGAKVVVQSYNELAQWISQNR